MAESSTAPHERAAEAFARQVRAQFDDQVETVVLFGSVARGDQRGAASDVDLLVVHRNGVDAAELEERIREVAYDLELEHAVVLSLIVLSAAEYDRRSDRPFYRQVRRDAQVLYG